MFIHWGIYSEIERGEWVKFNENIEHAEYDKLRARFNPTEYDPQQWARLMQDSGIKYVVITARHHDGFSMFETAQNPEWSIMNTPYGQDVMKPLVKACQERGIMFFFYYSLLDWTREDFKHNFYAYLSFMNCQLAELCENYGPIGGIWFDGVNFITDWTKWDFSTLIKTIKVRQPHALVTVNQAFLWDSHKTTLHGDVDFITYEKRGVRPYYQAGPKYIARECCTTIGEDAWGYHKEEKCIDPSEAIMQLVSNVCKGGNFLLNTGPDKNGRIPHSHQKAYRYVGDWLKNQGEAIYGTCPSGLANGSWGGSVQKGYHLYYHIWNWPDEGKLVLENPSPAITSLVDCHTGEPIPYEVRGVELEADLSRLKPQTEITVLQAKLAGLETWLKIECEDYISDGQGVYHHPITSTPMQEVYRKDDLGCELIEEEPGGVCLNTRKHMSYVYHIILPRSIRAELFLRARERLDDRASRQDFVVSIKNNGRFIISHKKVSVVQSEFQCISLGEIEIEEGENFITLTIEQGCAQIDYLKLVSF